MRRRRRKIRSVALRPARKSRRREVAESLADGLEAGAWYQAGARSSQGGGSGSGGFWRALGDFLDDLL